MAAAKGNKYWQLRSKDGREKDYTPEEFLEAIESYFDWCDKHPIKRQELIKSGNLAGTTCDVDVRRPYLKGALCNHLHMTIQAFDNYGNNEKYKEYFTIFTYAIERINSQNLEGGYVGQFDSGLVARKLGLVDKKEMEAKVAASITKLSKEAESEYLDKL